jgi:protein-disulfide isomerase
MAKKSDAPKGIRPAANAGRDGRAARTGRSAEGTVRGRNQSNKRVAKRPGNNRALIFVWAIGAAVLVLAGVLILRPGVLATSAAGGGPARTSVGTTWGKAGAPVTIVEYSNFGCPHCQDFAQHEGKQLRQDYESSGKVEFEFKPFKLADQSADDAANAALCAADQQRFWDYHDLLFQMQATSATAFSKGALKEYASQLHLDTAKFGACVDSSQHMAEVDADSQEGLARGVDGTPTFFINKGDAIVGVQPYDQFKAQVDAAIKAAG